MLVKCGVNIPFNDFKRKYARYRREIDFAVRRVFKSGFFILGQEVACFEQEFAKYSGVKYAVGVNSGTDALFIALKSLGIGHGDEVITVANTATPTVSAIRMTGAIPRFVDVDAKTFNLDSRKLAKAVNKRTKAILPVHLFGYPADMEAIMRFAKARDLFVVEDACQAHGAEFMGEKVGTIGDIGCFSFYPTKNLGAFGDGGMIVTNKKNLHESLKAMRNYGELSKYYNTSEGMNSRLDEIQAAILRWSLGKLNLWNMERSNLAQLYRDGLKDLPIVLPPLSNKNYKGVNHLFVIRSKQRDKLAGFLKKQGIGTSIHYPRPIYSQPAYKFLSYTDKDLPVTSATSREILSLPLRPELRASEVKTICDLIKKFYGQIL